jgi:hypothetical protein
MPHKKLCQMSKHFVHEAWNSDQQTAKCPLCHAIVAYSKVGNNLKLAEHVPLKEHQPELATN